MAKASASGASSNRKTRTPNKGAGPHPDIARSAKKLVKAGLRMRDLALQNISLAVENWVFNQIPYRPISLNTQFAAFGYVQPDLNALALAFNANFPANVDPAQFAVSVVGGTVGDAVKYLSAQLH